MKSNSFFKDLEFIDNRVKVTPILETSFSKEIRIAFMEGQVMREHVTAYPIVVHLLEGRIDFGTGGKIYELKAGDILTLEGNVPHDLLAREKSIVRLSLSKSDGVERVNKVAESSSK